MAVKGLLFFVVTGCALMAQPVSFERTIQPILTGRCVMCHPSGNGAGDVSLSSYADLMDGGLVESGKPEESVLLRAVVGEKPRMPKVGGPLKLAQLESIRQWIAEGAKNDIKDATWWSLRPLGKSSLKSVDSFLIEKLKAKGLGFSVAADRRTLIRRLSFDLHGLPPTPEEVATFEADRSPAAYEKLVDRMLASPRYGERWARHWLDVVHYGDSHGFDKDKPRANSWPYRDAVIRAFNEDLPYGEFVRRQLAGDVLNVGDPRAFELTGFLAAGPWDFVGHQELREGTTDKKLTRVLDRDDMVATTVSAFSSMTAHCARCHDHKFDPIPQEDYYRLQAVFAGVDRADRPYDEDASVGAQRRALMSEKLAVQKRLQPHLDKVEFATSVEIAALDDRIQDAGLLLAHLGTPKDAAQELEKKTLEERRVVDRAARQKLVDVLVGAATYAAIDGLKAELKSCDDRLALLPAPKIVYSGAGFFTRVGNFRPSLEPRPVHLLDRGGVNSPGKLVGPGALRAVPGLNASFEAGEEGSRRAALAQWITNEKNVLTWRSIVNRVWHHHFGVGLVDSPSDFGKMGSLPSHPELLDWLAVWFRDEAKGSLKQLHRLLVTSVAYQQVSAHDEASAKVDTDNRLLWRMNRTRLDAESVHDATLAVAGKLDLKMGGPGVRMFGFKDDHSPVYDYTKFDPDAEGGHRRSIYRFVVRSVPDPFMERLDCPDPSVQTPKRSTTLTAIQALAMWNNPFMLRMAEHLAARVGSDVGLAGGLVFGRDLRTEELSLYRDYSSKHGMANLARLLLNTNEFLFVD